MKISVSYLGSDEIGKTLSLLDKTTVDFIHVDVMDGKYVKQKTIGYGELKSIGYYTKKRLDVHFMVMKPLKYIDDYANLNVSYMTVHLDMQDNLDKVIERIKLYGIKVGIAVNPSQDIELVYPYLSKIDLVLIMTVVPGLPGQKLIPEVIPKIDKLKKEIKKQKVDVLISCDGGINKDNKHDLKGSDILAVGSYITNSKDYEEAIQTLRD